MLVTMDIDDALLRELQEVAASEHRTVSQIVEDALRAALVRWKLRTDLPVFGGSGLQPGVDISNSAVLLDIMEGFDGP